MKTFTLQYFVLLLLTGFCRCKTNRRWIIYSTGYGELKVRSITNYEKVIKTFYIQTDDAKGGIAVDEDRGQIFFADGRNIYKIYLVDEKGERKISGSSDLFFEKHAQHFEVRLFIARRRIEGIYYDKKSRILYAAADTDLIELNVTDGNAMNSRYVGYNRYVRNPFIHNNVMYVYLLHGMQRYYGYTWGIYDNKKRVNQHVYNGIVYGNSEHISGFAVDRETGRLFINMRSTIRLVDPKKNSTFEQMQNPRIVLGNSKYTSGLQSIAVHGNDVIWSSSRWNKLFKGVLQNGNFISSGQVKVFDNNATSQHMCIFRPSTPGDMLETKVLAARAPPRKDEKNENNI